ncbi:MAG TPA: hypothetical protein VFI10_01240 [Gaiellaceae bacterium]|jgi:hypothetical protein|nr:hypothetical protein [Gaiellaceae bacterium]
MQKKPDKRTLRERTMGLDPDDAAARWLAEHEPKEEPQTPKAARKSKLLHRYRRRNVS